MTEREMKLRREAEHVVQSRVAEATGSGDDAMRKTLHELNVYQTELELQNEELRHSQHQMHYAQERYRSLYHDAPVGYVTLTPEGHVTEVNRVARALIFGRWVSREKSMADYIAMRDRNRFQKFLNHVADVPDGWSEDFRALRPSASGYVELRIHGVSTKDQGGHVVEFRLALSDVSALKRAQRELQEIAQALDQRIQDQLTESHRKERQLHALIEELNHAEQRARRRIADELHDYLAQLLVAARLRTANIRIAIGPGPSADGLQSVEDMLREAMIYTRTLMAEISPTILFESGLAPALRHLAEVMFDNKLKVDVSGVDDFDVPIPTRMLVYQCVRELLHNCLKHAQTDAAYLSLHSVNGRVQAVVRDEGRGADPAELEAAEPLREKFGLFSIRERVTAINGNFMITTSPGCGMTCVIEVPPQKDADEAPESDAKPRPRAKVIKAEDAIRVLVVDDHMVLRQGLVSYFSGLRDIAVAGEAMSGSDAIAKAAELHPDVVLMDVNLPDMSGVEVTRRIKSDHPDVAIVGLSMRDDSAIVSEMSAAGAAMHLGKDAAIDQIVWHLFKACGREMAAV